MNRKQLILLLGVLLIIGAAGLVLVNRNKESWALPDSRMGQKVLPNFRMNDVAGIRIEGNSELNLYRKDDVWRVKERFDYPANFHQLSDALIKIQDLKAVQSEPVDESELAQVKLEEPGKGAGSGTLVQFLDAQGKVLDALILGKPHVRENGPMLKIGSADGRWMLVKGDPHNALLVSEPLSSFVPMPEHWISKDFIKIEKPKAISYIASDATNSWKVMRETETSPWTLADTKPGERLDTNLISTVSGMLNYYTFIDVKGPAKEFTPTKLVKVETFDHFTYTLRIGEKAGDAYDLMVGVEADLPKDAQDETTRKLQGKLKQEQSFATWVYRVSYGIVDPVTRDRARIMDRPAEVSAKDDSSFSAPTIR